jgi:hypothetical protein
MLTSEIGEIINKGVMKDQDLEKIRERIAKTEKRIRLLGGALILLILMFLIILYLIN